MADQLRNNVKVTVSNTPSTSGAFTVSTASTGCNAFVAGDDGLTFSIRAYEAGVGSEFRTGCTYTHSGTSLSRGMLEGGSALNFTSAVTVEVIATAAWGNSAAAAIQAVTPGGRLTLESGVPVSPTDQTAKSDLWYTPYIHNIINLWDGAAWKPITFVETKVTGASLTGLTSGKPYDVFAYLSSGSLALEVLVWTNDTTRATAVTLQDGRYCKSGDKTRLLVGTFYTTGTTTTADAEETRYVSNAYNEVNRRIESSNTTSHTYTTGAWREWNGGTGGGRVSWVSTLPLNSPELFLAVGFQRTGSGTFGYANIGYDSTDGSNNLMAANIEAPTSSASSSIGLSASASVAIASGKHYATVVQYGESSVTYTTTTLQGTVAC